MHRKRVYVVDDDAQVVRGLTRVLALLGYEVAAFDSAQGFLAHVTDEAPSCVLLDAFMRSRSSIDVLDELERRGIGIPVIFISGHADVHSCASAMKRGAVDYLLKPLSMSALQGAVADAHAISAERYGARQRAERAQALMARLTAREREVLDLVLAGRRNKEIASALASQEATVKVHRSRLMHKLQVRSIPELVLLASQSQGETAAAQNVVPLQRGTRRDGRAPGRRRDSLGDPPGLPGEANAWAAATGTWTAFSWPRS